MKKPTILFVAYGGGHVNMLVPVIHALGSQVDARIQVLGLTTAGAVLERAGIPHIGFRDLLRAGDESALERGRALAADVPSGSIPKEESVAYLGLSYTDLCSRLGAAEAERLYVERGRQAFLPLTIMERLIMEERPDLVVATNSPRTERAAILTAGKVGIASVCLVDLFAIHDTQWIGQPGYANRVCVFSDYTRQLLISAGRPPADIVVTGNPAFDRLSDPSLPARGAQFRADRGWSETTRVVLWASQAEPARHPFTGALGDPQLPRLVERKLIEIVGRHPDWVMMIRPHPSEKLDLTDLPERVYASGPHDDLAESLMATDVVVAMSSTVGLEGAFLGKPLVTPTMSVTSSGAPYAKMGIALGVEHLAHLEAGLQHALDGQWRPAGALPPVGGATAQVVRCLAEVLGNVTRLSSRHLQ